MIGDNVELYQQVGSEQTYVAEVTGVKLTGGDDLVLTIDDAKDNPNIQEAQKSDPKLNVLIEALSTGNPLPLTYPGLRKCFIENGLLCRRFQGSNLGTYTQIIIPSILKCCVQHLHDNAGHLGVRKTTEKVKRRFYWPGYEHDIEEWVRKCEKCQQRNIPQFYARAPLGTIAYKIMRYYGPSSIR